jgi:hypothetical protein
MRVTRRPAARHSKPLRVHLRIYEAARCQRAGLEASVTLQTAALLGSPVDLDLLGAVLKRPPLELLGHLEEGARRGRSQARELTPA